jgi:hypothetical protein
MCAKCIVLDHESRENFLILQQQHIDLFQPANEVEVGMIEEMCAAYWRQRRAWSIETALLEKQIALQPDGSNADRMAAAFDRLAAAPTLPLLHRYEARQHTMYQRAMRTLIMLRTVKGPNDPSPVPEHRPAAVEQPPPPRQAPDSEPLCGAANPGCSGLSTGPRSPDAAASAAGHVPASSSVAPRDAQPEPNQPNSPQGSGAPT